MLARDNAHVSDTTMNQAHMSSQNVILSVASCGHAMLTNKHRGKDGAYHADDV
jgi:hypothetical protein